MLFQDLNIREVLLCWPLVLICAFLFGLRANLFAFPSSKCHLNAFTVLSLTEMPRYQGYIPKIFLTVWSLMNHLLCFANLMWFHFGISHIVMFCFTLVFNFLLVWVTTLTLLKPNRMQLPRAQTVSLAGEPHSRVWQGTWYGTFPPPASPFHSFACSGDDFGITPRALGRGRPGVNNNMQGKTREAYRSGATYFNQRGSPVPCLQHVLYMGLHSLWEWQRTIFLFVSHWQSCSPSHLIQRQQLDV